MTDTKKETPAERAAVLREKVLRDASPCPIREKVRLVNALLLAGEPGNITKDQKGYTGYSPQPTIDAVNRIFAYGEWWFNVLECDLTPAKEGDKSVLAIAHVEVVLQLDGEKTHTVSAYGEGRQPLASPGDALKSAQTDALKKALSYLSVGQRAYCGLLNK